MTQVFVRDERNKVIIMMKVSATTLQMLFILRPDAQDLCSPVCNRCMYEVRSIASNCLMVMENELESTWKEAVMDVLGMTLYFPEGTEENYTRTSENSLCSD